jgi:hypothetical protein
VFSNPEHPGASKSNAATSPLASRLRNPPARVWDAPCHGLFLETGTSGVFRVRGGGLERGGLGLLVGGPPLATSH